jgi:uncharacterized membrane protein YhhN
VISLPLLCTLATVVALFGLLSAEQCASVRGRWATKPLASAAMVATALSFNPGASAYGRGILVALGLSFVGDLLLLPTSRAWFRAGLFTFLAGHLAFAVTFLLRGIDPFATALAAFALGAAALGVGRWLLPRVEPPLRAPVIAYIAVITVMVALAAGTVRAHGRALILIAAIAFYVSDLSVARHTFVKREVANRLWGLPLYYAAQLMFAWSLA